MVSRTSCTVRCVSSFLVYKFVTSCISTSLSFSLPTNSARVTGVEIYLVPKKEDIHACTSRVKGGGSVALERRTTIRCGRDNVQPWMCTASFNKIVAISSALRRLRSDFANKRTRKN